MNNNIKMTGNFFDDLRLAICSPERESENPLVRFILGPFQEQFIVEWEKQWKSELTKLSLSELNGLNKEACILVKKYWKEINAVSYIMKRFGYILSREFFDFCERIRDKLVDDSRISLALYVASFREIYQRARLDSEAKGKFIINPDTLAAFQALRGDSPVGKRIRQVFSVLGSNADQDLYTLFERDISYMIKDILGIRVHLPSKDKENPLREVDTTKYGEVHYETLIEGFEETYYKKLTEHCNKKFADSSDKEILLSMWDKDSGFLYNHIEKKCINEAEGYLVKQYVGNRKEWREYRKLEKELTARGEKPRDELRQKYNYLEQKRIRRVNISHTEPEDWEDIPTEIEVSNEEVEYFIKDPERTVIDTERRQKICSELQTWAGKQAKQARLTREVVEYVIRAVTDPFTDSAETFQVTKIAEALNTDKKEIRRIFNKIKKEIPIMESLLN